MRFSIIIWFCISICSVALGNEANVDVNSLIHALEKSQNCLKNIQVNYSFYIKDANKAEIEKFGAGISYLLGEKRIQLSAKKPFQKFFKYSEEYDSNYSDDKMHHIKKTSCSNGNILKFHLNEKINNNIFLEGTISPSKKPNFLFNVTPLGFSIFYYDQFEQKTLAEMLRYGLDNKLATFKLDKEIKNVNGFNTICLETWIDVPNKNKQILTRRFYFSTDHNFALVKMEGINGAIPVITYSVSKLQEIGNGFWFPMAGEQVTDDGNVNGFRVNQVIANSDLKDELFDIEFPPGTRVNDKIQNRNYIVKPTQEQLNQSLPN